MEGLVIFLFSLPHQLALAQITNGFPPEQVCKENWGKAAEFARQIEDYKQTWTACGECNWTIGRRIDETLIPARAVEAFWFSAWWVTWPPASLEERRAHRQRCRDLIGDQAFFLPWQHWPAVWWENPQKP